MEEFREMVRAALREDVGAGDVTTTALIEPGQRARASMNARERLVLAGLTLAEMAFKECDPEIQVEQLARDGDRVAGGGGLLRVRGPARGILTAERVALNLVQRLSGIATLTRRYVDAVAGTKAEILDTRKTLPLWRALEKYAVKCGGGRNHRLGLFDMVLVKDNHLAMMGGSPQEAVKAAVACARRQNPSLQIEVEADSLEQAAAAAESGADIILLDNMAPALLKRAVELIAGRARTEASGGIHLQTVRAVAETGVDFISVGALTHSAPAVDIGLDFEAAP